MPLLKTTCVKKNSSGGLDRAPPSSSATISTRTVSNDNSFDCACVCACRHRGAYHQDIGKKIKRKNSHEKTQEKETIPTADVICHVFIFACFILFSSTLFKPTEMAGMINDTASPTLVTASWVKLRHRPRSRHALPMNLSTAHTLVTTSKGNYRGQRERERERERQRKIEECT